MRLLESLRTADGVETIRVLCERILQELIEAEATEAIGAAPGEHSTQRTTCAMATATGCRRASTRL
jgi:transposase-like protein